MARLLDKPGEHSDPGLIDFVGTIKRVDRAGDGSFLYVVDGRTFYEGELILLFDGKAGE